MNHLPPIGGYLVKKLFFLLSFCLIVAWGTASGNVAAQSVNNSWQTPWNVSLSGTATEPLITVSVAGAFHLFWQDRQSGYTMMRQEGEDWLEPQRISVPFTDPPFSPVVNDENFAGFYQPLLRVDGANVLHAAWLDDEARLVYSRAPLPEVAAQDSWSPISVLASSVRGVDLVAGEDGRLHLAYIGTTDAAQATTGVSYRYSDDGGSSWAEAIPLYTSNYLRTVSSEQARIQVVSSGNTTAVLWDNPILEEILLAVSSDRGNTWDAGVQTVDRREPEDNPIATGPGVGAIVARNEALHLVWRAQHGQESCRLYHQWSDDGGRTWSEREIAFTARDSCPTRHTLLWGDDNLLLLAVQVDTAMYMQVWENGRWYDPIPQQTLTSFSDPVTYRDVVLGCHQFLVDSLGNLVVVGCGRTTTAQDVWIINQQGGGVSAWSVATGEPPVWSMPESVFSDGSDLSSLTLLPTASGEFHAFWLAAAYPGRSIADDVIYYATWDGRSWSRPAPVAAGTIDQITAAVIANDHLLLVWRDYQARDLFFSQATISRAAFPSDWAEPRAVLGRETAVTDPDLVVEPDGQILLHYAVSLNEERGIYLLTSSDENGLTWGEPVRLFDAVAAQWDMVAESTLVVAPDGRLHLLFPRYTLPGGRAISLHYMRSEDQARTWTEPQLLAEGNISWSRILVADGSEPSVIWQAEQEGLAYLWHRLSDDGGETWLEPARLTGAGDPESLADVAIDRANHLHGLQTFGESGNLQLQTWLWGEGFWQVEQTLTLPIELTTISALRAAIAENGRFVISLIGSRPNNETGESEGILLFSERLLDLPETLLPTPPTAVTGPASPSLEPTISPASEPEEAATPEPTPVPSQLLQAGPIGTNAPIRNLLLGILPALLLVFVVSAVGYHRYKKRER